MNGMHLALLDLLLFTLECVFVSVRVCVCVYILVHDFLFFFAHECSITCLTILL